MNPTRSASGVTGGDASHRLGDRFDIERVLGHGGMATVFLARDRVLERQVALKVLGEPLAGDPAFRERFGREARLAARLGHPNIVQVYDVGEGELGLTIVMEYVEGETLSELLARRGRLPPREVVAIGSQLCSALAAAHAEQLVHRDIKPQNVIQRPDGQIKLADFGIARSLAAKNQTALGTVLGTAAYLAPEQGRGERVTAAADIYSLGVVLYELVTGAPPFTGKTPSDLFRERELGDVVPPHVLAPEVPPPLEAAVLRCLSRLPADRPTSAKSLGQELERSIAAQASAPLRTPTRPTEALRPPETWSRREHVSVNRRRVGIVLAAGLVLLVVLAGLALEARDGDGPTQAPALASQSTRLRASTASTLARAPTTPAAALTVFGGALEHASAAGQIGADAVNDLDGRVAELHAAITAGKTESASAETGNLIGDLRDLAAAGLVSPAAFEKLSPAARRLAALLPAEAVAPPPRTSTGASHGHGHGKGRDESGDEQG